MTTCTHEGFCTEACTTPTEEELELAFNVREVEALYKSLREKKQGEIISGVNHRRNTLPSM